MHADKRTVLDDDEVDSLIYGLPITVLEQRLIVDRGQDLRWRYQGENPHDGTKEHIWTPYQAIRGVGEELTLHPGVTLYDLGSGWGRLMYLGLTTGATIKGIELVEERAAYAELARRRLGAENVSFRHGGVLDADFSDGDIFYLYQPFNSGTRHEVVARLKQLTLERETDGRGPLIIAARLGSEYYMQRDQAAWLRPILRVSARGPAPYGTYYFQSKPTREWSQ